MRHFLLGLGLLFLFLVSSAKAGVKPGPGGFEINAGDAGIHTMSYPRLLTPGDQALKIENVTVKEDGSGVTMTYSPSGKLSIDLQADGSWLFHFTEIPPDRVKFFFGINFPLSVAEDSSQWSFDSKPFKPFPAIKGEVRLHMANPNSFVYKKKNAGFIITYPQQTFTTLTDQRVWGKTWFNLGMGYYFPGKKSVPEISYSIKIEMLSPN